MTLDTDGLTLDSLILFYRERVIRARKSMNEATTAFNRRKWKDHFDKNTATVAFLEELAERRERS